MRETIYKNKSALIEDLITPEDIVLDVGFWGQGVSVGDPNWVHGLLRSRAKEVHGLDLDFDPSRVPDLSRSHKGNAEDFLINKKFSVVFAGDLIEHLPNPGLFLGRVKEHIYPSGKLIITTPNTFNLFNIFEKITKKDPTVNPDHTCYFNPKTIKQLLAKCGWKVSDIKYVYSLGVYHRESWKKKIQNIFYKILSNFTDKFVETMVVVAEPIGQ